MKSPARLGGLTRRAWLATTLAAPAAWGLGRIPLEGRPSVPSLWPLAQLDPHDIHDMATEIFGRALFDSLFDVDARGRAYPALAAALPTRVGDRVRVTLRAGLVTGAGATLDGRDVVFSLERARRGAAASFLGGWRFRTVRGAPLAVDVTVDERGANVASVAAALASPATAIVPRRFAPREPDGTGAFRAERRGSDLVLSRNVRAARGPAYLDGVRLVHAPSLDEQLRAFEAREVALAWLGAGLHSPRKDAHELATDASGWFLLHTGRGAGAWGAPGVAQSLVGGVARDSLGALGVAVAGGGGTAQWSGPATQLWTDRDNPHLGAVGAAVAASLSTTGHEITLVAQNGTAIRRALGRGDYPLVLDFVRRVAPTRSQDGATIASAVSGGSARAGSFEPHVVARSLPVGVVGSLALPAWLDEHYVADAPLALQSVYVRK